MQERLIYEGTNGYSPEVDILRSKRKIKTSENHVAFRHRPTSHSARSDVGGSPARHLARYVATIVLALCSCPSFAQNTSRLEQVIQPFARSGQFMGAVLVSLDGKTLLDRGYGYADLEWKIPDAPDTKFRLGSITKQFTAASILLLQERGKLKLSDPVKMYIPNAPKTWDHITIYNLLTHTSGIPDLTHIPGFMSQIANPTTPEHQIRWFLNKPLEFAPGTKYQYSNSGYILLGYIIEQLSGTSYQRFLRDNIFGPLGMRDTGYDSNQAIIRHRASGYSPGTDGPVNASYINMTQPFSAGGLYSTTRDLLRWEDGLFGGKSLSPAALREMTTPFLNHYGCGLRINSFDGHTDIHHAGGINGFNSEMDYFPKEKLAIIVLANLNGPAAEAVARRLAKVALTN